MAASIVPVFLNELKVKSYLTWPAVYHAVQQALLSVSSEKDDTDLPTSSQPARTLTLVGSSGLLFSMPGFIGNYTLPPENRPDSKKHFNTLACKLVTSFPANEKLPTPLPNIMATICLFDTLSGQLKCILEATEITGWRTAAASLVATQYLYFSRPNVEKDAGITLAIIGCGVQGRSHAIGMCTMFNIKRLNLWNRTKVRAETLKNELEGLKSTFKNQNVEIHISDTTVENVTDADVVVTATFTQKPILFHDSLKNNVHINAVGAGASHHAELDDTVYSNSTIYVDNLIGANSELKTLGHPIEGEVGEIMNGKKQLKYDKFTIFHSMGMAVEDCTVAELVYELHQNSQ